MSDEAPVNGPMKARGVTFASFQNLGLDAGIEAAAWAQDLGFGSFWTAETVGPEAFTVLGAIAARTPSLDLGTGVLALQLRTPMVVAMGGATLQALNPDREILLGVGVSSPVVTQQWHGVPYGDRPLARTREYVTLLRECLAGETVTFDGEFFNARKFRLGIRLGDRRPKIILAALNKNMLRLAGECADGVLLNYLPASHVPWAIEQVRLGEARTQNSCRIYAYVHVGVCERNERTLEYARRDLFSYAVVDGYAKSFSNAGFEDDVAKVAERHAAKDREGAVAAISEAMIDAIDIVGDANHVRRCVKEYVDAGVDVAVIMPLPWAQDRLEVVHDTMRAVAGQE